MHSLIKINKKINAKFYIYFMHNIYKLLQYFDIFLLKKNILLELCIYIIL